jgi:hypothetical protein
MTDAVETFPAAASFEELRGAFERAAALEALGAERLSAKPAAHGGWSPHEHLAHLALAAELCLRNVQSLVAREGLLIRPDGEPLPAALDTLRAGHIERGIAEAPRMVRPPAAIDPALLSRWLQDGRAALEALARDPAAVDAAPGRIPHQLMGPLSAAQWVRFAAVHTQHHVAIARELLAASA